MKKLPINIHLSSNQLRFCLITLLALNLLMLTGTWAAWLPSTEYLKVLLRMFDLASENTIATWYSSMLLLFTSFASAICFRVDWQLAKSWKEKYLSYGWLFCSFIFILLSLDEIGSYHETIGDSAAFNVFGGYTGWTVFYILILLVGAFMLAFSVAILIRSKWTAFFTFIGLLLLLSNPLQENYEINSFRAAPDPALWVRPVSLLLLEEGSEIFASSCFLISTVLYILHLNGKQTGQNVLHHAPSINLSLNFERKSALLFLSAGISLLSTALIAVELGMGETTVRDEGIPKNWFPSAIAFLAFLTSLHLYQMANKEGTLSRFPYLLLALMSVYISMSYGSNLYAHTYWDTEKGAVLELVMKLLVVLAAAFLCYRLLFSIDGKWSRIPTIAWAAFLCAAFILNSAYTAAFAFIAYTCLLFALTEHLPRRQLYMNEALQNATLGYSEQPEQGKTLTGT